jgi:diguanylate cyclase (GGDEF)-like protein
MEGTSWLLPDGQGRERMLDMDRRLQPVRRAAFGVLALCLLAMGPWAGFWTLIPLALAAVLFRLADARTAHLERPEYAIFAAWAASEVIIAVSVGLTGASGMFTLAWLAIPIVTLSARFSTRGVAVGVGFALVLLTTVVALTHGSYFLHNPALLLAPAGMIVAVAMLSTALMQSDLEHRSEAVIDQLTGMLNRKALATRAQELCQQSEVTGQPIALIVGDLDSFKSVNDTFGHARGDAALTEVAYVMRKSLRAFDLAYRVGGEEFVVLMPGAAAPEAAELAETLRRAVSSEPLAGGVQLTMSFGVSGSAGGEIFHYDAVFAQADAALYEAKSAGRDRVRTHARAPTDSLEAVPV